jgi:hypothetical protein
MAHLVACSRANVLQVIMFRESAVRAVSTEDTLPTFPKAATAMRGGVELVVGGRLRSGTDADPSRLTQRAYLLSMYSRSAR